MHNDRLINQGQYERRLGSDADSWTVGFRTCFKVLFILVDFYVGLHLNWACHTGDEHCQHSQRRLRCKWCGPPHRGYEGGTVHAHLNTASTPRACALFLSHIHTDRRRLTATDLSEIVAQQCLVSSFVSSETTTACISNTFGCFFRRGITCLSLEVLLIISSKLIH